MKSVYLPDKLEISYEFYDYAMTLKTFNSIQFYFYRAKSEQQLPQGVLYTILQRKQRKLQQSYEPL